MRARVQMRSSKGFIVLCHIVFIMKLCWCRNRKPIFRVRFGIDDIDNKYPYVVKIQSDSGTACTGTLIAANWVLTAGHCDTTSSTGFGNITTRDKQVYKIQSVFIPPNYKNLNFGTLTTDVLNDIALMKVNTVKQSMFGQLSGLSYESMMGYPMEYAGFGDVNAMGDSTTYLRTSEVAEEKPVNVGMLQLGEGVVVPCDRGAVTSPTICIGPKCSNSKQDSLPGDSGGPLFYEKRIVGVLTAGVKPPVSMYTPVSSYLDWIRDTITAEDSKAT